MVDIKDGAANAQSEIKKNASSPGVAHRPGAAALKLPVAFFSVRDGMIFPLQPWELQVFADLYLV